LFCNPSIFVQEYFYLKTSTDFGTLARDNPILLSSQLDPTASVALLPKPRCPSSPSYQTISATEGTPYNTLVDEQKFNYNITSSGGGFEKKADTSFAELCGDQRRITVEKFTRGNCDTANNQIGTIETAGSTPSLVSLTSTYSPQDSSKAPSIDSKRQSGDDDDQDQRRRKRQKGNSITGTDQEQYKFACPYRKHDPAKYGIQHGSGICALSQWDCISRVKFVMIGRPREYN